MTNLQSLAALLQAELRGPGEYPISGVRDVERLKPEDLLDENKLYFIENLSVFKRHPKAPERGAVLTTPALSVHFPRALVVPETGSRVAFFALLKYFDRIPVFATGVSPDARVHPTATVSADASVLPGVVVMEGATVGARTVLYPGVVIEPHAEVGSDCVLYPNVVIGHHCVVGNACLIHGGTVIGSDGFGFFDQPGVRHKVPQIGNVVLGNNVELGSGCTLDRATIETTSIGDHTKIDNQVHIGHNCRVGRFCYIAGNTGLAGSVTVEDGVMISGMVSIKDHLTLAKGSVIMGMSGVAQDTEPKTAYFGTPALPARQMHKMHSALERLPELLVRVRELEAKAGITPA